MNMKSTAGIALVLALAACNDVLNGSIPQETPGSTSGSPDPSGGSDGSVSAGMNPTGPVTGVSGAETGANPVGSTGDGLGESGTGGVEISPDVTVQLTQTQQVMTGFGINITWAAPYTQGDATLLFNVDQGIGLNIVRIGMSETGDQMSGNIWTIMQLARQNGADTFIGTLWSPPANCKSNNNINGGGTLLTSCYESWSDTIAEFPAVVRQNTGGIQLYGMSPQNETDFASCGFNEPCNGDYPTTVFTGQQMADFVAIVGPKLHALTPPVQVIAPEASEWLHVWSNESACCSEPSGLPSSDPLNCGFPATNCTGFNGYDYGHALYAHPTAWQYVDILGVHQYDTQVAEPWPDDVPDRKPVWQTEMSGVRWWPEQGPSGDIGNGVAVARWIHSALTVGDASAWLWWWYRAEVTDDNEGLLLQQGGTVAKRLWTLGNYSKFIRRGYTRVDMTGVIPEGVLLSAFNGPDGTVVVVAVNEGTLPATVPITIAGGTTTPALMTPWVTSATEDLATQTDIPVTAGIFTAELAGQTVTTFVGR